PTLDFEEISYDTSSARSVVEGDFDGDDVLDLALTVLGPGQLRLPGVVEMTSVVQLLFGFGDGTFQWAAPMPSPRLEVSLTAGDYDLDGDLDLAVVGSSTDRVTLLQSDGKGGFQRVQFVPMVAGAYDIVTADLNTDGSPDLIASQIVQTYPPSVLPKEASILWNDGGGSFQPQTVPIGGGLIPADLDGDGRVDVIVESPMGQISVYLNSEIVTAQPHWTGDGRVLAAGDLDGYGGA